MTGRLKNYSRRTYVFLSLSICLLISLISPAYSHTVITQSGPCSFLVTLKIEVWGENATQEVVDRWKKNIEGQWNGPTKDTIETLAQNAGIIDPIDESATEAEQHAQETANNKKLKDNRDKLNKMYEDMLKDMGLDGSSTQMGCCTVKFVVDIKLRGDSPTDDYHQIEAVPSYEEVEVDGVTQRKKRRSYVSKVLVDGEWKRDGQNQSVSGRWRSDDADWPPEAHESGHLMGLGDQYHDEGDSSVDEQGHEADIMADNLSWPHESGLAEIMGQSGFSCNKERCCPTEEQTDRFYQVYGITAGAAGTAIAACNFDVMNQTLQDLNDQMRNMALSRLPMAKKIELHDLIKSKIDQIKKAKIDCGDPKPDDKVSMGDYTAEYGTGFSLNDFTTYGKYGLGSLGYTLGTDSTEFCTYGGGNESPPVAPPTITFDDPGTSGPGTTPGSTPGSTPGTTPGSTPGTTPGTTPGSTPGTTTGGDIFSDGFESGDLSTWYSKLTNPPSGGTVSGPGVTTNTDGPAFTPSSTPDTTTTTKDNPTDEATPDDPNDNPDTSVPQITYHMKAKDSVLQPDGTHLAQNMGGERIKLIDPSLQNPQLAMDNERKVDIGYSASPTQCTTDDLGECDIKIDIKELISKVPGAVLNNGDNSGVANIRGLGTTPTGTGLTSTPTGAVTPIEVDVEVTGNKKNSQNMIVPNSDMTSLPADVLNAAASKLTIGDNTYLTYDSGYSLGANYKFGNDLKLGFDLKYDIEENICGDEQPGPPMGTFVDTLGLAAGNDIPGSKISLPGGGIR